MAEADHPDYSPDEDEELDNSDRSASEEEDDSDSDNDETVTQRRRKQPCKYYNKGDCRNGAKCDYLHVCAYYFNGNCKYGKECKFSHDSTVAPINSESDGDEEQIDGPPDADYHWQVRKDARWLSINHDWLIEAQYSQPGVVGIKIYNTKFGALSIDFKRMKIRGKAIKVRRWNGQHDQWVWYCRCDGHWAAYGKKDSQGKCASVDSAAIEQQYKQSGKRPFAFTVDGKQYQIDFREMKQINLATNTRRKVRRRPKFLGVKIDSASVPLQNIRISGPVWQFLGDSGQWHNYKGTSGSVTSDYIENEYQNNTHGSITFSIRSHQYQLDFAAMTQTNLTTNKVRRVQRV
ncbi:protein mono-ADP-ribosyltransferase PARP12-like [Ambystoma mexicanum]|uniref:protein mono-ADP-ribosyltransferase PARP12-like n=1 Tax=Ambystoma mexicanum TaxID=8296 RepID=UPI0037E8BCEC